MKIKTLKKKILRLEKRLKEGPKKLAKLKQKLATTVAAKSAAEKRKASARAAATRKSKTRSSKRLPAALATAQSSAAPQPKRKLNLSPERRAALSAAMKARWAARKASMSVPAESSNATAVVPVMPPSEPWTGASPS